MDPFPSSSLLIASQGNVLGGVSSPGRGCEAQPWRCRAGAGRRRWGLDLEDKCDEAEGWDSHQMHDQWLGLNLVYLFVALNNNH